MTAPAGQPWFAPPVPIYSTIQQPAYTTLALDHPASGLFSLDNMVRQTAAGFRGAGPILTPGGGAVEGLDLPPPARRVLWAHQLAAGFRAHGQLTAVPPAGDLPPLTAYPAPYSSPAVGTGATGQTVPYPHPAGVQAPRPDHHGQRPPARERNTDELAIPFSTAMLGSFSPYRGVKPTGACFECNRNDGHFALECPAKFARIKGEAPPGWRIDGPGQVSRNPAEWNPGQTELTDAARAQFRHFVARFPVTPANIYPMSVDEITAAAPPAQRRPTYTHPPRGAGGPRP
jgi:hypothetical protein